MGGGWVVHGVDCKAACMTACVAYNYKSTRKVKATFVTPKQNGSTTILL